MLMTACWANNVLPPRSNQPQSRCSGTWAPGFLLTMLTAQLREENSPDNVVRGTEGAAGIASWEQVVSWCFARILPDSVTVSMGNLRDFLPISPKMGALRNVVDHRWDKTEFVTSTVMFIFLGLWQVY